MLRNKTVPVAKVVTARVTLHITVRDVKKRAMKAPTAATDINIPKTAALAVADVRSVVHAVSPVAVIADIIPAFTPSTTYFHGPSLRPVCLDHSCQFCQGEIT
jgi:hypothetical protein